MQSWTASPSKSKPVVNTLAGGINQAVEPVELADGQCTDALNVDSFLQPTLQTRDGYTLLSQHTGYINRIFKFQSIWYCGNAKGLYKLESAWQAVYEYSGTDNSRLWDAAMFFDGEKLYFVNGSLLLQEYDGSTLDTMDESPEGSAFLTTHANRFYLANRSDNLLSFSGLRDAADWTSTNKYTGTGQITVETADGERPTGLVTFADHVILFKRYSMHELFGEDSTNFTMQQPYDVGCISDRTIVQTQQGLFFLSTDGVYRYSGGAAPVKVSGPIKNYITSINQDNARHCCAGTDGRFLYLSLVTGSATLPGVTLKMDLQSGAWWPCSYVATAYYLDGQTLYIGTADGRILQIGGTSDAGTAISWSVDLKPMSDGDETARGAMHKVWVVADIDPGATLTVAYAVGAEGGLSTDLRTITGTSGIIQSVSIPVVVRATSVWFTLRLYGTGRVKIHRIIREITKRGA